jgi:quinol monooxygenase YgiN
MAIGVRLLSMLAAGLIMSSAQAQTPAPAAPAGPVYVVTYFESIPAAAGAVAGALQQFATVSRREAGNAGFVALRESGRPSRFAFVEAWRDKAAFDANDKSVAALQERLRPHLAAPFDRRPCVGLDVTGGEDGATAGSLYVLTHVDVIPPVKDQAIALVRALVADSRKDSGTERFDAVQQGNRANHMFLVEAWRSRAALDAHAAAEHTRAYRDKLLPLQGALYDERVYTPLR